MKEKTIWLILNCLMVAALLLLSCAPAVTEEETVAQEEEVETIEETVAQEEEVETIEETVVTKETPSEPEIPAYFTTYTSEGLFSISYPPDWVPAISIMGEVFEETKERMMGIVPEFTLETAGLLFLGGVPTEEGYDPNVNIIVGPRSVGYWTVDEIVEAECVYTREHTQRYREYSRTQIVVDGREAVILDWEDYNPDYGTWRYLQLFMTKDKFVWLVACSTESEQFKDYEDTFYSIVRSLRILK